MESKVVWKATQVLARLRHNCNAAVIGLEGYRLTVTELRDDLRWGKFGKAGGFGFTGFFDKAEVGRNN